jgi:plastocyanin
VARPTRRALGVLLGRWHWTWFLSVALALALAPIAARPTPARAAAQPAWGSQSAQVEVDDDEDEEGQEEDEDQDEGDEDEGEEGGEETGDDDFETWESETYGFTITYDPEVWEISNEDTSESGDFVSFFNGPSFVSLSASDAYDGDFEECFDDWVEFLEEESADIEDFEPYEDEDGDPIEDEGDDFVQGAFSFTSPDGDEVFDVECRVLIEDQATLVILLETFEDQYEDQVEAKDELLEGLDLSDLDGGNGGGEEVEIEVSDFVFSPGEIEIVPGTTVTWFNEGDADHTVTGDDDEFDSGELEEGDSFSITFEDEGEFDYHCDIHPDMTGTVIVEEENDPDEDVEANETDEEEDEDLGEVDLDEAEGGAPLRLADDFEAENAGIFTTESSEPDLVRYDYDDGEYVIETLDPDAGVWQIQLDGPYADVEIAVDARIEGGTSGRFVSVGCRFARTDDLFEQYSLVVDPADQRVLLYRTDEEDDFVTYFDESGFPLVNPDEESNRLELRCVGETIAAAVNGEVVATVEDDVYVEGAVYLGTGTYADVRGTVEARWDNLEVTILDGAAGEADDTTVDRHQEETDGTAAAIGLSAESRMFTGSPS